MERTELLIALYAGYLSDYNQRVIDNGPFHGLHKFLLGNSTSGDRKADKAFFSAVEQSVAALAESEEYPGDAVRHMLLDTDGVDDTSRLMIEAAQGLALPLLSGLSREDAARILAEYKARYPKKRMLSPKQRELLAALESRANGS